MDRYQANCETGEITVIPLTTEELAQHERDLQASTAAETAAHAALMEQRAADQADHALIRAAASGHAPIDQAFAAAVARQLGSLNG